MRATFRSDQRPAISREQLERVIDRGGGVRERTDGDEVYTGGGDLVDRLEVDATARLKLYPAGTERDGLRELRRTHVIEEDDVDAVECEEVAHLCDAVSFEFDANARL